MVKYEINKSNIQSKFETASTMLNRENQCICDIANVENYGDRQTIAVIDELSVQSKCLNSSSKLICVFN